MLACPLLGPSYTHSSGLHGLLICGYVEGTVYNKCLPGGLPACLQVTSMLVPLSG